MAEIFEGSEPTFTPVAGDYIRSIDDPTGTPISGNVTYTQLVTLLNTLIGGGPGTSGNVLTSNGSAWTSAAPSASGVLSGPGSFMDNGVITVSVTSNNLTVAIKTIAGADPSAGDPVKVRIGNVYRSITSALSVTKNAATNWCNAGSAELATQEIDYFVYLGYNATDGVTIGFSRIPYAKQYSEFSTTTTDPKYCAISTITNAAAGDNYVNIGRFAATLSAGAGYTWSVPTFTAINLIQRPIYETRILSYLPQPGALSPMTYGTLTVQVGTYQLIGNLENYSVRLTGTTGGTATTDIYYTIPMPRINTTAYAITAYGNIYDGANLLPLFQFYDTSTTQCLAGKLGGNWGLGTSRSVICEGRCSI